MSLRVGQKVKTPNGEGKIKRACVLFEMFDQRVVCLVNGLWWDERQLTPLPEPERVLKAPRMPDCTYPGSCVNPLSVCFGCGWRKVEYAPSPGLLQRMGMCTYPELYICEKAGGCSGPCIVGRPHERVGQRCHEGPCYMFPGVRHCIPYVPEDEAREWIVLYEPVFTRRTKAEAERLVKSDPDYRMFRWSDGLKGGE